jgi:uncharacterized repeat protein (TIGR04052 family)
MEGWVREDGERVMKTSKMLVASGIIALVSLASCGDTESDSGSVETRAVALNFEAAVGGAPFSCTETYELGLASTPVQFTEFKLFVSNVVFVDAAGNQATMQLLDDSPFSEGTVSMLDFEDASGGCANGTPETNTVVRGSIPADFEPVGVSYEVGVPFESNHQDQAVAPDPLSLASMFWNWRGGYKFIRIDGTTTDGKPVIFHLGSTGCMLAEGSTTDVEMCMNPNRVTVVRDNIELESDVFVVDAGEIFEDVDLSVGEPSAVNCQSMASDEDCTTVFPKLGLPFAGTEAGAQTFITVKRL